MALSAVLTVGHGSHEDTSTTSFGRAFTSKTLNLSLSIDLVELEDAQLDLLALVLDLLWGGVHLLLALLATAPETEDEMESRLLLDVVVAQGSAIFELFSGKDETLLVRWYSFLVLDFCLDVVDGIRGLDL